MPRKTWGTKADFDDAYSIRLERYTGGHPNTRAELRGNYERRALFSPSIPQLDYVTPEWERILAHFGWPTSTSICIIGTGFGWAIEYLNSVGFADVWGVDNSAYIQGAKDEIDPADGVKRSLVAARVRNENMVVPGDVKRFLRNSGHRNGPGGEEPFDVVVTERVLSSLEDSEATFLSGQIRTMNVVKATGTVLHLEEPPPREVDLSFNWHTAAEWKALLPNDTIGFRFGREFL